MYSGPYSPKEEEAIALARKTNKTVYVNRHWNEPLQREFLFVDDFKGAWCCAIVQPSGEVQLVVQAPQRFSTGE